MAVKRYDGTDWQTVAGKGEQGTSSSITTWVKTASGGETSLTGSSDSSTTLAYTPGQEQFFINGVLQVRGSDYTATNGTSITGISPLIAGDVATVTTVNAFSVTGAVPLSTVTANGDLIVGTSSGAVGRLGVGSTGQLLTVSGGVPTWAAAPASGGMTLISTTTLTGASVTLSSIPTTFKNLFVVIRNYVPVVDFNDINFRFNADSTANRHRRLPNSAGDQGVDRAFDATFISMPAFNDNSVGRGLTTITIPDYANTTTWKKATYEAFTTEPDTTTNFQHSVGYGFYNQLSAITSLQFLTSGGNFSSGTILLYGVQ